MDIFASNSLLAFILACYGLTTIICISKIFHPIREFIRLKAFETESHFLLGVFEFLECPMCVGFWVGLGFSTSNIFDINILVAGLISSGSCWLLHNLSEMCYWSYNVK